MTVNKMSAKDVPAAAALDRLLFSAECWTEQDFYDSLNDPTRLFWVACEGETILGCCGLQTVFEDGDVLTVGVHPDHRRKGVGSALMREIPVTGTLALSRLILKAMLEDRITLCQVSIPSTSVVGLASA